MANGTVKSPLQGGLNYEDYQKRIQQAAAATRATGQPSAEALSAAKAAAGGIGKTYKETTGTAQEPETTYPLASLGKVATAAVSGYEQQAAAQQQQAEKAASALEMVGETTLTGVKGLEQIQAGIRTQVQKASETWDTAAEKADEYVKAARSRVGEVLSKLDDINDDFAKERSFAKAHAMQAGVQATLGSMKDEERNIAQNYGTDSAEYQQFQASKRATLGTVQSNIHASYQQLAEQQKQTYMNAVTDAYTKSNMYVGFQEQQHVEMLKYSEEAKTSYVLQAAQMDVTVEQMKMAGMENLANWMIETPSFTMDITPLMTMIADLQITEQETAQAAALAQPQIKEAELSAQRAKTWTDWTTRGIKPPSTQY